MYVFYLGGSKMYHLPDSNLNFINIVRNFKMHTKGAISINVKCFKVIIKNMLFFGFQVAFYSLACNILKKHIAKLTTKLVLLLGNSDNDKFPFFQ